jgi:hypothetical protein
MAIKVLTSEQKDLYRKIYLETYSVSEILRQCQDGVGRSKIQQYLTDIGIYEGLTGNNYLKIKAKNHEELMMAKHGVKNWGQISGGFALINDIPYDKLPFDNEYSNYCKNVKKLTDKNVKKIKEAGVIPSYCQYSGIMFAECERNEVNPNDWRKRSVDHIKPIISCFFDGDSIEYAAGNDNIAFVLKYINSIKGNSTLDSCKNIIQNIKERFINAGYTVEIV